MIPVAAAIGVASAVPSATTGTAQANGTHPASTGAPTSLAGSAGAQPPLPLQIASGPAGKISGIVRYVVNRVSLADIAAGQF